MVRRRGDKTPEPSGGRAAARLGMFEQARGIAPLLSPSTKKPDPEPKKGPQQGEGRHAKQVRPKDRPPK